MSNPFRGLAQALLMVAVAASVAACGAASGTSRNLDSKGVEFEATTAKSNITLPPGATFRPLQLDPEGVYEQGEGRSLIEFQAMCAWYSSWVDGIQQNDQAVIDAARDAAKVFPTWSTYQSTDGTGRAFLDSIRERAELGDPGGLVKMVDTNCR